MTQKNLTRSDLSDFYPIFDLDNTLISEFEFIYHIFKNTINEINVPIDDQSLICTEFKNNYLKTGSFRIIDKVLKNKDYYQSYLLSSSRNFLHFLHLCYN